MNVNLSRAAVLSVAAAAAFALPAQAATVKTTALTLSDNPMATAAYAIDDLNVGANTYNVTFEYGTRASVYGSTTPEYPNADAIGNAIVEALQQNIGGAISLVTDLTLPDLASNTPTDFYIPKFNMLPNVAPYTTLPANQRTDNRLVTNCYTGALNSCTDLPRSTTQDDRLMYAKFTPAAVPTPALIPGLIGLGLAGLRKKKQG